MGKTVTKSIVCQPEVDAGAVNAAIPGRVLSALRIAKEAFFALCVETGKEVLATLMEQERTSLCGVKGVPNPERRAVRGGHTTSRVTLGGRRIEVRRPRARSVQGAEVSLPSFAWAANRDPLDAHTLDAIAVGVSTRRYARSLDALPEQIVQSSTSKSAVSRRFVALSCERLKSWLSRSLAQLDLPVLMIDAIHFRSHIMLIVLGIDTEGRKHVLGMRQGATENTAVVRDLIADLIERGLAAEVPRLIVIDGARALRRAIAECFGDRVLVQRCQVHKLRNVREHLPQELHASVKKAMCDAWACTDAELAKRQLERLAHSLERSHPSAARSIREGLDETLTLTRLGVDGALYKTLRSTNAIENLNGLTTGYLRNVKRWRDGAMLERWVGAALIEVVRGFRKIRGCRDFKHLVTAIKVRCESSSQPTARKVA
jgi:transposase-like protein